MTSQIARQASALVCAAVTTLAMLAGTDLLATQINTGSTAVSSVPAKASATQVVVVIGQRAARS